ESRVDRVRGVPGVARADNLIVQFMNLSLPSGAEKWTRVYALAGSQRWGMPWNVEERDLEDLRRGPYMMMDDSSEKRFGAFSVGAYRGVFGRRLKVLGRTQGAKSFTTTPITFVQYDVAQSLSATLRGNTTYILVK